MILYINTIAPDEIIIALSDSRRTITHRRISAPRQQAEKLLPAISRLLEDRHINKQSLKKIVVANQGGSFTSLRIGVITANALAYALGIPVEAGGGEELGDGELKEKNAPKIDRQAKKSFPFSIVKPLYDRNPTIGASKKFIT